MLKTLARKLSRETIIKRRLPKQFDQIPLYVSPDARLQHIRVGGKGFEPELLRIVSQEIRPDSIVWDIGANVGVFSFAAASITKKGSVLAVEADVWLAQILNKSANLKENQELNIQILPAAISKQNGVETFLIAENGRASNTLSSGGGSTQMGGVREHQIVPTLTLDTLIDFFTSPTFVKIDVEGAEVEVLQGSNKILDEIRPTFYIEVAHKNKNNVTQLFNEKNYALFDGYHNSVKFCVQNTLAIPQEKL